MDVIIASPWVPVEWVAAHGHEPKSAWLFSPEPGAPLSEGLCPVARAIAELVANSREAVSVLPTTCDQLRRAGDAIRVGSDGASKTLLFNVPATWQTGAARAVYLDELKRLGRFLVKLGGHSPSEAELARTSTRFNEKRRAVFRILQEQPGRVGAEAMARCFENGPEPEPNTRKTTRTGVPLALLGGTMFASEWPLADAVEAAGGSVVLNATEPGERCLPPPVPIAGQCLTLNGLANHYFENIVDVFRRPNSQLYSWLEPRLKERQVRGIILLVRVGCDLWRAEAASLRNAFRLPILVLDSHRVGGMIMGAAGLRDMTRLTAFIEALQ